MVLFCFYPCIFSHFHFTFRFLVFCFFLQKNTSLNKKITFWFATGGAGFCLSRALTLKMLPIAGGGKFISIGDKIRFPDDVTMGFIIGEWQTKNKKCCLTAEQKRQREKNNLFVFIIYRTSTKSAPHRCRQLPFTFGADGVHTTRLLSKSSILQLRSHEESMECG